MARFTQVGRNEFPSTEPTRVGKIDVAYAYMDENMRTITFFVPLEEDSTARVEEELRKRIEHAASAGPKEITIP